MVNGKIKIEKTKSMSIENPNFQTIETADNKLIQEIDAQLNKLLRDGTSLEDIVDILDAQEFLEYIPTKKGQPPVVHFNVKQFVKTRVRENRKISLPEKFTKLNEVILPPSEIEIKKGSGTGLRELGIIPRSTMFMETLTELGLKYSVIEGKNSPKMVRKLSYLIFSIPSIEKVAFINDEEGNATYVVHGVKSGEWRDYIDKTKEELYEMPQNQVSILYYPNKNEKGHQDRWKNKIKNLLTNPIEAGKEKLEEAPEDWVTTNFLAETLNSYSITVKNYAEKYKKEHPEWFKIYKSKMGQPREFYSPELVKLITGKIDKYRSIPENWISSRALSGEIGVSIATLRKGSEVYKQAHPEWFQLSKNLSGERAMYYHPELIKELKDKFKDNIPPPENFVSITPIMKILKSDFRAVKGYLNAYRAEHPEWFKNFRDSKGEIREHYSVYLVKELTGKYSLPAPDGWQMFMSLTKIFGRDYKVIRKMVEAYRPSHPEWFRRFKNKRGHLGEFFSPELIEIIRKEIKKD
jgi:hypothetical protein